MKLLRPVALAVLALSLPSTAARAQQLFGLVPAENAANLPSAYLQRVRQEVTTLVGGYKRAWDRRNAEAAAALFTRDGRLSMPGHDAQSRPLVQQELAALLPATGPLHFSIMDFDSSGEMAFVSGQMSYGTAADAMEYVLVARRGRGDQWLIRSLVMMPAAPAAPAASSAATPTATSAPAPAPSGS